MNEFCYGSNEFCKEELGLVIYIGFVADLTYVSQR